MSKHIAEKSSLKKLLRDYKPSWFYCSSILGNVSSILLPLKELPEHESVQVRSQSG